MRGMCEKCEIRDVCTELCAEAEEYASQDYIERDESLSFVNIENKSIKEPIEDSVNLESPAILRGVIIALHLDGKSTRQIAELVPCSRRYVRKIIKKYIDVGTKSKKDIE